MSKIHTGATDRIRELMRHVGAPLSISDIVAAMPAGTERNNISALLHARRKAGEFKVQILDGKPHYSLVDGYALPMPQRSPRKGKPMEGAPQGPRQPVAAVPQPARKRAARKAPAKAAAVPGEAPGEALPALVAAGVQSEPPATCGVPPQTDPAPGLARQAEVATRVAAAAESLAADIRERAGQMLGVDPPELQRDALEWVALSARLAALLGVQARRLERLARP